MHAASPIAGKIVFLDPGHNGANDASITWQLPTGSGGTTDSRPAEPPPTAAIPNAFNWNTVLLIRKRLNQPGVRTADSRPGPDSCHRYVLALSSWARRAFPAMLIVGATEVRGQAAGPADTSHCHA